MPPKPSSLTRWNSSAAARLMRASSGASCIDDAIMQIVARMLQGVTCPPTDLDAVLPKLGIIRVIGEPVACSGQLRRSADGLEIFCSTAMAPTRRRFTVAHEMAHAFFERTGPRCPRSGTELERLCDMIASEILMPTDLFVAAMGNNLSAKKIMDLARIFSTSLSATAIRCSRFCRAAVFIVNGDSVSWSYGIGRTSRVDGLDPDLREAVMTLRSGNRVPDPVFMHACAVSGYWQLDGESLGANGKSLFLLTPAQRR